jgi:hypothetical protein
MRSFRHTGDRHDSKTGNDVPDAPHGIYRQAIGNGVNYRFSGVVPELPPPGLSDVHVNPHHLHVRYGLIRARMYRTQRLRASARSACISLLRRRNCMLIPAM